MTIASSTGHKARAIAKVASLKLYIKSKVSFITVCVHLTGSWSLIRCSPAGSMYVHTYVRMCIICDERVLSVLWLLWKCETLIPTQRDKESDRWVKVVKALECGFKCIILCFHWSSTDKGCFVLTFQPDVRTIQWNYILIKTNLTFNIMLWFPKTWNFNWKCVLYYHKLPLSCATNFETFVITINSIFLPDRKYNY